MSENSNSKLMNKKEITGFFKISGATLDNWIRTSLPNALNNGLYDFDIIQNFISNQNKLQKRANKKHNALLEAPKELLKYLENPSWIPNYLDYLQNNIENIAQEIVSLYESRLNKTPNKNKLSEIIPSDDFYAYSVAYQLVLSSGEKSQTGAYYTPKNIVQSLVEKIIQKDKKFLEPCSGVGFFCVEYIKTYLKNFKCLPIGLVFANDIDAFAARITELNIQAISNGQMIGNVFNQNALELNLNGFDIVLTNPPYGIKNDFVDMKTKEIFSHFIYRTLDKFLSPCGEMCFVLPISILSVAKHKEIRKYILDNYNIKDISHYGKSFDGVYSDIVSIIIEKKHSIDNQVNWIDDDIKSIAQSIFIKNDYVITAIDAEDSLLISQYESIEHLSLKDSIFALGIVTGNNKLFLNKDKLDGYKEIVSGKEVLEGYVNYKDVQYILDDSSRYQQKPPMDLFKKKKILYKFISSKLVTAVDNSGILSLNSANFFILNNFPLSEEYVSALLNSNLMNELYAKKNGNPIKVLKKSIQELPIFVFSKEIQKNIEENYKQNKIQLNNEIIEKEVKRLIKK